ncbi:XRN 5'-3' exonuclease N-terminus-domain-containing protein [Lophiotrema nucula]|uniref:5'-3' exoribonuclease 1 n=1 Tax=Lophiotrema nucula TaxID=690887 RepID=A0A6A5Z3U4_9PLEO|nr:XRN 5'-3' exonuclease N-terminus-domain-containing protein [Lophiotrema nucula]
MGVPKFFRWMSERYPAISQLIAENRIPEFDCLYLDMNGIIHNCTHNDSDSPTFRMTEDKMFIAIFNYIEHLFGKIKPKKLFFMAIDGVAPRAKMNQQRARRFRTALDAEKAREKAVQEGVEMPAEDAFDSNCITPGTEFMAKLTQQLKYFINKKVSEDLDWQGVEVVLSGHEVPGEGEHKIMEYIRQAKAQPEYDPNRRHCLYGLDADLIMLGLLSHDPHFALLREEVTFGRQSKTKSKELEHQNFYLMHLCIVREYLELEFQELKEPGALSFPFDMERVIDDFILMAFFVGNDFLPNLPHLHINEGALALMFNVYKTVLPKAKGYINEEGVINMERLALLLDELAHVEYRHFESENADAAWFKGKRLEKEDVMERTKKRGTIVLSTEQREIFLKIKNFVMKYLDTKQASPYDLPTSLKAGDRKFVQDLADSLHLQWKSVQSDEGDRHLQLSFPPQLSDEDLDGDEDDDSTDDESQKAILRVIQKYENAKVVDISPEEAQNAMEKKYEEMFDAWKNKYYSDKFGWDRNNDAELTKLTENYVQGLQWVLYYYYRGVASWPWFYAYHYSPMISDVKKGLRADINFKLGQPFKPYQQLMGVLPDRSKKIVPTAYHDLMTNPDSPIIDFYPREFELDMNGKKMEWEAVVKIPFIEETRLLPAMATKEHLLTEDEKARNSYGVSLKFTYSQDLDFAYPSSLPGIFPDLPHCRCIENIFELPTMDGLEVYVGLMDGVKLGEASQAGFPSLKTLPFYGKLDFAGVSVFQQDSRNESMIVTLLDTEARTTVAHAKEKLGQAVHVGFPFLQEAKVVKVSDELFDYVLPETGSGAPVAIPHEPKGIEYFKRKADRIENTYSKRLGMVVGEVEALVHVEMLKGLRKTDDGATVKEYAEILGVESEYASQTIVDEVISPDQRFLEKAALPVEEEFPEGARAFYLGDYAYGRPMQVLSHTEGKANIMVARLRRPEPDFGKHIARNADKLSPYTPSYVVARKLHMPSLALSKITASFKVNSSGLSLNLGLNLKFEAKKMKVLGYSRKTESGWEYSQKAIELLAQYMTKFPEFFAGIIRNPQGDGWNDTDFYPPEVAKQKVKEIGAWLKEIETKTFEKVPLDAEQLDSDTVTLIEKAADDNLALAQDIENKKIGKVPRSALLKPSDAEQRLGNQKFGLGDRVVYVQDSGRVPIGSIGTVVGKTRTARTTLLDVVFDASFMSGTTLGDRCSPFRGSTVPATAVLNLTDKQVISYSSAGAAKRPQQPTVPLTSRVYGAPDGPQLVPANTPPPLRGSYRGAFGGANANGALRGRGGGMAPRGAHSQNGIQEQPQQQLPIHGGPPSRGRGGFAPRGQSNGFTNQNTDPIQNGRGGFAPRAKPNAEQRGRSNGGFAPRGRGAGPNQGGFTVTDMHDPTEGVVPNNPNFRPQSYTNVPPPATLDAQRGYRGRGRGRGRGEFRGRGTPRGGSAPQQ